MERAEYTRRVSIPFKDPWEVARVQLQQVCNAGEPPGPVLFHRTARPVSTQTPS